MPRPNEEWWRYLRSLQLSEGRSAKDFDRHGQDVSDWLLAKGDADKARERRAWLRDRPGQKYPEHEMRFEMTERRGLVAMTDLILARKPTR